MTQGVSIIDFAGLSIKDEQSVEVKSNGSSSYSIDAAKSKVAAGFSPGANRYRPPFVLKSTSTVEDDPFQSPSRQVSQNQGANQRTPTGPRVKRAHMSGNWRSGSSSDSDTDFSPSREKAERSAKRSGNKSSSPPHQFFEQSLDSDVGDDETGFQSIKDEDSQAVFPPSCCVFVANLLQSETEEALQVAVTQVFREYGSVFVKIRRDSKQMPFAFCQYTDPEHAERAIREGRGRLIKGRPCRCEKAKAHRLFFVERKYGPTITPEEVRKILEPFGNITTCYSASNVERTALNLNEGVICEFEMYDEGQAAFAAYRNHELYKLHAVAGMASPSKPGKNPVDNADRIWLARYEVDRRSIFVGNIPAGTTEDQLAEIFEPYGSIASIVLRESPSRYDAQEKFCFAFIEFRSPMAVTRVIPAASKTGFTFGGKTLRIAQKDSDRRRKGDDVSAQSPAPRRNDSAVNSPASIGSPSYGTSFSPFYPGTVYTDGTQFYTTTPTSYPGTMPYSPYYSYPGTPAYTTHTATSSGSPGAHQAFSYYYPTYQPAPTFAMYPTSTQQQVSPAPTNYPPAYTPMSGTHNQDDRSTTPTPAGHTQTAESSLVSE